MMEPRRSTRLRAAAKRTADKGTASDNMSVNRAQTAKSKKSNKSGREKAAKQSKRTIEPAKKVKRPAGKAAEAPRTRANSPKKRERPQTRNANTRELRPLSTPRRSAKKQKISDDPKQVQVRDPEIEIQCERLRLENERYLAYCMSLLNMLQMAGVDPYRVLTNSPSPRIEEEFNRLRAMAVGFQGIPIDCTNIVCEFLKAKEVCALRRISKRCQQIAASAATHPRSDVWDDVDGDPVKWLEDVGRCFTNIVSVEIPRRDHMLHLACEQNSTDAIRVLMADSRFDGHPSYFRDHRLPTPLFVAARIGDADLVARLLARKEVDIASPSTMKIGDEVYEGATPLHAACAFGRIDVVPLLLASPRCDIHAMAVLQGFFSPLLGVSFCAIHVAAVFDSAEVIPLLLDHPDCDVNKLTSFGWSALKYAFQKHSLGAMQALLKHPELKVDVYWEDAYDVHDHDGRRWHDAEAQQCLNLLLDDPRFDTELQFLLRPACEMGDNIILGSLMAHAKVNVNARFLCGQSALHVLVYKWKYKTLVTPGCWSCIDLLLGDDRFDPNTRDSFNLTVLHILAGEMHLCTPELLSAVLRCRRVNVNVSVSVEGSSRTPLQMLVKPRLSMFSNYTGTIRSDLDLRADCVAAFAERDDADFAVKDDDGNTLLHDACDEKYDDPCARAKVVEELVRVFKERNLSIETRNASGETPLDLAKKADASGAIAMAAFSSALGIQQSNERY